MANDERGFVAAAVTHFWVKKGKHDLSEMKLCKGIDEWFGLGIIKRHCPVLIIQKNPNNLWPLRETQQLCMSCTCPVLISLSQTKSPVAFLRAQCHHTFPVDRLLSYTQVPRCLVAYVDLPVVPPSGETLNSKRVSGDWQVPISKTDINYRRDKIRKNTCLFTLVARTHGAVSKRSGVPIRFCSTSPSQTCLPSCDRTSHGLAVLESRRTSTCRQTQFIWIFNLIIIFLLRLNNFS